MSAVSGSLHEASYRRHQQSLDDQLKKWEGTGGPMQAAALPLHCMRACRPEAAEGLKKQKPEERNGPARPELKFQHSLEKNPLEPPLSQVHADMHTCTCTTTSQQKHFFSLSILSF